MPRESAKTAIDEYDVDNTATRVDPHHCIPGPEGPKQILTRSRSHDLADDVTEYLFAKDRIMDDVITIKRTGGVSNNPLDCRIVHIPLKLNFVQSAVSQLIELLNCADPDSCVQSPTLLRGVRPSEMSDADLAKYIQRRILASVGRRVAVEICSGDDKNAEQVQERPARAAHRTAK